MDFIESYLQESVSILKGISRKSILGVVERLARCRSEGGRVFALGVGGSAANASHLVNDLRKIAGIETYAPTDNVSELTARVNDEGWEGVFAAWLAGSHLNKKDVVFVFSVGGGDLERNISPNLVRALELAKQVGAGIVGVIGREEGYTNKVADACVVVPNVNPAHVTPHTESFHSVIGHIIVSHPLIKTAKTKWESALEKK